MGSGRMAIVCLRSGRRRRCGVQVRIRIRIGASGNRSATRERRRCWTYWTMRRFLRCGVVGGAGAGWKDSSMEEAGGGEPLGGV